MNNIKILNEFGITPSNTYVSAGADFYVPNISPENHVIAFESFRQSYGVSKEDINMLVHLISDEINIDFKTFNEQLANIIHLYLGLDSADLNEISEDVLNKDRVAYFINNYLIFDDNNVCGLQLRTLDQVLINSGIHVALEHNTAGIFFNKSGRGNSGWDIRAQVVDEDYSGFVHLSLQYTKKYTESKKKKAQIFCGDKLTQMVILPIHRMNAVEISKDEYFALMSNSSRGSKSFGHSDNKH